MKTLKKHLRTITIVAITIVILFPFVYSLFDSLLAKPADSGEVFLVMPDSTLYEECVRETEYMRFHHWELLHQVREEVVRHGIRKDISFSKCAECHTSREVFCNRCHDATSLKPDCFGCHYYP